MDNKDLIAARDNTLILLRLSKTDEALVMRLVDLAYKTGRVDMLEETTKRFKQK